MTELQRLKVKAIKNAAPEFLGYSCLYNVVVVTFVNTFGKTVSQQIDARGYIRKTFRPEVVRCLSCV